MCMRIYVIFLDTGLWQMYSCGNVEIMFAKKLDWLLIIVILIMVVVTSLPYFYAAIIAGDEYILPLSLEMAHLYFYFIYSWVRSAESLD